MGCIYPPSSVENRRDRLYQLSLHYHKEAAHNGRESPARIIMNERILYRQMLRIRRVEERLMKEYIEKNIRSFIHLCIGQEAIAVGVCHHLSKSDLVFGNFRSHGHYLAKGGCLKKMIAELFGKSTGCCGGRGGSMHLCDKSVGFMGTVPILASIVPIAVGAGFSIKKQGKPSICVVFLGDGACGEGIFLESINFANVFKVPILFVVENNLYSVMSPMQARHSVKYNLGTIIEGIGSHYIKADGNDVLCVSQVVQEAINKIKESYTPVLIEFATFRHTAHSGPIFDDHLGYRTLDDWDTRLRQCPIKKSKERLLQITPDHFQILQNIEEDIEKEIDEAITFAENSPFPHPDTLTKGVYHE